MILLRDLVRFVQFKVNESRYKQRGVTPHFSTGQNLLENILREKINIDIIEKSFLIDPLTTNNATYSDSLSLKNVKKACGGVLLFLNYKNGTKSRKASQLIFLLSKKSALAYFFS